MKSIFTALLTVLALSGQGQTVMQLSGPDCNGNDHDLFADLDAGKAVILHFFMANCGSCPPPAQKIQAMANNILDMHPGMITAYAMPSTNATTCSYTAGWTNTNGLSLYMPYDSGAVQVANYGGFGMPTVVLLGGAGADRRVMFSTLSFSTSDTTIMRDSIMGLLEGSTGIFDTKANEPSFGLYPNPAANQATVSLDLNTLSTIEMDVLDNLGNKVLAIISSEKVPGRLTKEIDTSKLANGNYIIRVRVNGAVSTRKLSVTH